MPGPELSPRQFQWVSRISFILGLLAIGTVIVFRLSPLNGPDYRLSTALIDDAAMPDSEPAAQRMPRSEPPGRAAALVVSSQTGHTNNPLPIGIALTDGSGGETVTLLGLANGFEPSLGTSQGAGGWLLSARDLAQAFVGPTKDFVGSVQAMIQLHSASGQLLDSKPIQYEWLDKEEEQERLNPAPHLEPAPPAPIRNFPDVAILIERAEVLLRNGDITSARLLLKRAATDGSAQAAFELGMTFDPAFLKKLGVLGVDPDEPRAREWYERASKLGSVEASLQLKRLAGKAESDGSP